MQQDTGLQNSGIDPREFRNALGCFPTGVTIITTLDPRGQCIGITANSFNSVSMDPPLILFELWDSGCPILPGCTANFECRTEHTYDGGDHVIFVGRVIRMRHDPAIKPLLFH